MAKYRASRADISKKNLPTFSEERGGAKSPEEPEMTLHVDLSSVLGNRISQDQNTGIV